jgi:hypothetical protein
MTPQAQSASPVSVWDPTVSPQPGPTCEFEVVAGIDTVFPMLHTLYEYYEVLFNQ